jgi:hypothetical protein
MLTAFSRAQIRDSELYAHLVCARVCITCIDCIICVRGVHASLWGDIHMYHTCVGCTLVLFGVRLCVSDVCGVYCCTVVSLYARTVVSLYARGRHHARGPVRVFLCVHCVFLCVHCVFLCVHCVFGQGVRAGYAFVHVVCAGAGACMCIGAVLRYLIVYACKAGRA